jgi:signal peptidase I
MTAVSLAPDRSQAPRRVWLALLLTLLLTPAAGYLYVGRPFRALAMALAWALLVFGLRDGFGGWLATPGGALTLFVGGNGLLLFALVDAARIAWRERVYRLRGFNRWWVYVLVGLVLEIGGDAVVNLDAGGFRAVRPFTFPSVSMAPTLNPGDLAIGDMRAYERAAPQPGDLVIFKRDGEGAALWVKRVVAGPGDSVALVHGVLVVNDTPVRLDAIAGSPPRAVETLANGRSHVILPGPGKNPQGEDTAKVVVPPDAFFVLGDNRGNSDDSRFADVGFVPRAHIVGRMSFLAWSSDRRRIGATIP